jgi:Xaa-Pro dipeptidase
MSQTDSRSQSGFPASVPFDHDSRRTWTDLTFPLAEYNQRLRNVRQAATAMGLDALVVVGNQGEPSGVRYLSNYTPRFGTTMLLIPLGSDPVMITDGVLHGEPMHSMVWNTWFSDVRPAASCSGHPADTLTETLAEAICDSGLGHSRIGIASPSILSAAHGAALRQALPGVRWQDGTPALAGPRAIKSSSEIAMMRRACEITAVGLHAARDSIRPGVTEREVAAAGQAAMFLAGAEELGFDTAVSSGPRAGLKHAPPSDRAIAAGDLVFLDMGAVFGGYRADMSRCVAVWPVQETTHRMFEAARVMFEAAFDAVRPGNPVSSIYRAARQAADCSGFLDDYMPNGLGHGLGLSLWEVPYLTPRDDSILRPGMIFALEPMLVRYGLGTAVIEETILVTENGAEALSGMPW